MNQIYKHFFTLCSLTALALSTSAKSGGVQLPVAPSTLPEGIRVSPAQGIINLNGQDTDGHPLGCQMINIIFPSHPEMNPDMPEDGRFEIYVDDETNPRERIPTSFAVAGAMDVNWNEGIFSFNHKYNKRGTYRITVPAGVWLVDGNPSPALELFYEITRDYRLFPEPGIVDDIYTLTLSLPSSFNTDYNGGIKCYRQGSTEDFSVRVSPLFMDCENPEDNTWEILINTPDGINTPGIYNLEIPAGAFKEYWYGPGMSREEGVREIDSQIILVEYIIPEITKFNISPKEDEQITSFDQFTLSLANDNELAWWIVDDFQSTPLYMVYENGEVNDVPTASFKAKKDAENNTIILSRDDDMSIAPGEYLLQLGKGLVYGGSKTTGKMISSAPYSYRLRLLDYGQVSECTVPSGNYTKISEVEIRYPQCVIIDAPDNAAESVKLTYASNGREVEDVELTFTANNKEPDSPADHCNSVIVNFNPPLTNRGIYKLTIPGGLYRLNSLSNPELCFTYNIDGKSGVENISSEAEEITYPADVYGIDGMLRLKASSPDDLQSLPAGLYIISGRKIAITGR